jgi:hypothetical protein
MLTETKGMCRGSNRSGVGFAAGYGVREWKSRKRRRRYAYLSETEGEAPRGAVRSATEGARDLAA